MPETDSLANAHSVIGFDFGLKRIGVASGNFHSGSTSPLETIRNINGRPEWHLIDKIIEDWHPAALVVGLPVHDENPKQPAELAARAFAKRLRQRYNLPVHLHNESHSSNEASRIVAQNRRQNGRAKTRLGDIDKIAAALILETWINEARSTL